MIEKGFWGSLKRHTNQAKKRGADIHFAKCQDAFNSGWPDVVYRVESTTGLMELKYVQQWPKRSTTKVKFKATAAQIQQLKNWYGKNGTGQSYGLLGVDREWFLLDVSTVEIAYERGLTQEELRTSALVSGTIGGVKWQSLISFLDQ